jgi:hypothetical protein
MKRKLNRFIVLNGMFVGAAGQGKMSREEKCRAVFVPGSC